MPTYEVKYPAGRIRVQPMIQEEPDIVTLVVKDAQVREIKEGPRCWCEYPEDQRFKTVFAVPPKGRPVPFEITNCPTCGKAV